MLRFILPITIALLGIGMLAVVLMAVVYNRLVRGRLLVREGFSGIDVQLKRRHDLIPNLVQIVQGYAAYEKNTLETVTTIRAQAVNGQDFAAREAAENQLTQALKSLLMLAEAYPHLRADSQFLELQRQLANVENYLEKARRYYNGTVREYNTSVQSFPSNMVAHLFGFPNEPFFQLDAMDERAVPQVMIEDGQQREG